MPHIEYEALSFSNAYIYSECHVPLANQGLVLIRGLNADDGGYLGAGKSSIFEVFSQLQMGKGGKREQKRDAKNDIVNMFSSGGMKATLSLRIDGHPYEIKQFRAHERFGNKVLVIDKETGQDILPRDAARSPHKWIREQLLQLDETSFFNLIYMIQELNNVMVHGAEHERRSRLTVMFNLDVYDELRTLSKRSLVSHEDNMHDFEQIKSELDEITQKLERCQSLDELEEALEQAQKSLEKVQVEHQEDMDEYTKLSGLHSKLQHRDELRAKVLKHFKQSALFRKYQHPKDISQEDVDAYKNEKENVATDLMLTQHKLQQLERRAIIEAQLAKLSGRPIEEIQDDLAEVKQQLTHLNRVELPQAEERERVLLLMSKLTEPTASEEELEEEYERLVIEETKLKSRINDISSQLQDAVCPHCKRPFDMSAQDVASLQNELSSARAKLESVLQKLHTVKADLNTVKKVKQLKSKLGMLKTTRTSVEVMKDIKSLTAKEKALTAEYEVSQKRSRFEVELSTLPTGNKSDCEDRIKTLENKLAAASDTYEVAKFIVEKLEELKTLPSGDADSLKSKLKDVKDRLRRMGSAVAEASTEVAQLRNQVDDVRQMKRRKVTLQKTLSKQEHLVDETACLRALTKAFGSNGLKQDRFSAILTDATDRTVPAYTDILWPNRDVNLRLSEIEGSLQFELDRVSSGVSTKSNLLSGGERHKAGLALLFGMRDLKGLYTRSSANVLIVDEPFGNMDPLGTEGLITIFSRLRQRFGSVFVVSHRPEVLSHPIWDQTWWVIRENNNAKLYLKAPPARYQQLAAELVKQ